MTEVRLAGAGVLAGRRWLFRSLDLQVRSGQCAAVVGQNGSGKSTLLRCVYGMADVTEGEVIVAGGPPRERSASFRRRVSALLDDSDTFAELTVRQHIELLFGSFGTQRPVEPVLDAAGLAAEAEVSAGDLSAGQLRRLLLAGATERPFEVLLLDEPERALDADGRRWLVELVSRAKRDAAVLVASHHRPLVDAVADEVVELG